MLPKQPFLRTSAAWWAGLLVFAIILTGCGDATDSTLDSAEPATDNQAEQAVEEPTSAEPTEEVAVQEETESESQGGESQQSTSSVAAECRTATPENDPLMALLQPNPAIAPVSDDDWSKGPADAPVTIIEYGDFQ